jgi:hypothetical protein
VKTIATETRGVRRIRKAVESRGYGLASVEWEKLNGYGEGGWFITLDRDYLPNSHPGNDLCAETLDDLIAYIDHQLKPAEPCACGRTHHPLIVLKGDPPIPLHDESCPNFLRYRLAWWPVPTSADVPPPDSENPAAARYWR